MLRTEGQRWHTASLLQLTVDEECQTLLVTTFVEKLAGMKWHTAKCQPVSEACPTFPLVLLCAPLALQCCLSGHCVPCVQRGRDVFSLLFFFFGCLQSIDLTDFALFAGCQHQNLPHRYHVLERSLPIIFKIWRSYSWLLCLKEGIDDLGSALWQSEQDLAPLFCGCGVSQAELALTAV